MRVGLKSAEDKIRRQEAKIEALIVGGVESAEKLKKLEETIAKSEMELQRKETQKKFNALIDEVTPNGSFDGNLSSDMTIEMKLMEKNVSFVGGKS